MSARGDVGAVLLMTLLVMSLMAVLAVSLMDDVRYALRRTANVQAYAQADWYLTGAEDYAQNYLSALLKNTEEAAMNAALLRPQPVILPLEAGSITVQLSGGSQCLSLGALSEDEGRRLFRQLLEVTGWSSLSAANFISAAADWTDPDSRPLPGGAEDGSYLGKTPAYRTANTAMASVRHCAQRPPLAARRAIMPTLPILFLPRSIFGHKSVWTYKTFRVMPLSNLQLRTPCLRADFAD